METNRQEERVARGIVRILVNAIDVCVATGKLGKRSSFAEMVDISENVFTKACNQLTPITMSEMWQWLYMIKSLDQMAYEYAVRAIVGDQTLKVA